MNIYDTLGVRPDASTEDIKKAYRALARRTHPDIGGEAMKPLFLSVTDAWETLSDPARRAEYDRANGLNTHMQPEPEPPAPPATETATASADTTADEFWDDLLAKRAGAGSKAKAGSGSWRAWKPRVSAGSSHEPGQPWRTIFSKTVQRRRRHYLPGAGAGLLAAWVAGVWILGAGELVLSGPEGVLPRGSGALSYAACWAAGLWACCYRVRRSLSIGWGPLTAVGAGTLIFYTLNRAHPFLSAAVLAAGFALSIASAAWVRRADNLKAAGLGPASPKVTAYVRTEYSAADPLAQKLTRNALAELLAMPGTRLIEDAPVRGRSLSAVIVNGDRAAVIDSRILPDWIHEDLSGDVAADAAVLLPNLESTITVDVSAVRSNVRNVRGWLIIHPSRTGSFGLKPVRGVAITAASPAAAVEEIGQWLAEGSRAGLVDPDLIYRMLHGTSPVRSR